MKVFAVSTLNISKSQNNKNDFEKRPHIYAEETHNYAGSLKDIKPYFVPFKGLWFENNVVKEVKGKEYQGAGLYKAGGNFLDFSKVGWEYLSKEPIDITTATEKEIYAFCHANALAEANDTTWVRRYNSYNVTKPLAVFHTLNSQKSKEHFASVLKELYNFNAHKNLDVPIVNNDGKLSIDCVVFDTETTGLNLTDRTKPLDKIIQIGAIQVKNGDIIQDSAYNQLLDPEMHIPEASSDVHGITDDMVQGKPTIETILKPFVNDYMNKKNGVIVAYNSKFDMTILNNAIEEHNSYSHEPLKARKSCKVLDPFILIQRIHPYLGARKKLSEQYKFLFCKNLDDAHDAFADVKGTVDVMKYCLYFLNENRKDKTKPLTLREVLIFQNGGKVENLNIPLDNEGCNARVSFNKSYSQVSLAVDNYFKGYKLTGKALKELVPVIGEENARKLERENLKNKTYDLNPKDGYPINPQETKMLPKQGGVENAFYVMEKNFKKVLGFCKLEPYGDKTQEEIIDIIAEKAKYYVKEDSIDIWMKNPNPVDIRDGNDLPDFRISKKVLIESHKAEEHL